MVVMGLGGCGGDGAVIFKEIYYTFTKNFIEHNFFPLKSYKKMSKGRPRRHLILFELFKIEIRAN